MKDRFKKLRLQTLDRHIAQIHVCDRPTDGWIGAIRKALGMSMHQLATRMGISQQSVSKIELNELDEKINIKTLRKAAEALGCRPVYALIPDERSLQGLLYRQALKKAEEIVSSVDHTMQLEAQGVGNLQEKIQELAEELASNPNSKLWD